MLKIKTNNEKFCIPIKLIGKQEITADFYIDTGFNGYLKIDKKTFDDLGLECIKKETYNFGNAQSEQADISRVKLQTDNMEGECEVIAVGWGGRNLIGTKFLGGANIILVIDGLHGVYLTNNRAVAYEIGKTIYTHHNKLPNI